MLNTGGRVAGDVYALLSLEEKLKKSITQDPIVSTVDLLLYEAISLNASDIHLQPHATSLVIRYRIDGVLYDQSTLDATKAPLIISRLKVLSNLDIAQRRVPQDGRFKVLVYTPNMSENVIDFRVSTFPTLYGEKMVIRILDRSLRLLSLDAVGFAPTMHEQLLSATKRPHGLFLVTGPTGCGKTTMLYALISALDMHSKNIVTIEDPIEYELPGITQSQVNIKAGFSFENGLRAILRQDPDVIMVGEIRDKATAHIAIESALTGHLVLSTLHTNDAPSAVVRLLEMGIEPFLVSATLSGVLAQRLARRLCSGCKCEVPVNVERAPFIAQYNAALKTAHAPVGCKKCHTIGYKGRVGIFELLLLDDTLRDLIMRRVDVAQFRKEAFARGMKTLIQDGLEKVKAGVTSLDEVAALMVEDSHS